MNSTIAALLFSVLMTGAQAQEPFVVEDEPLPATEIALQPGQFLWLADPSTPGQLIIVVSLGEQRAYLHRGNTLVAISTISSGRPGRETPTGVYEILQKEKMHRSNLYDDAPMPYMQRLTWEGVALHAGRISGQPSSHGCVRLPSEFARVLFNITQPGELVVISDDASIDSLLRLGLPDYLAALVGNPMPAGDASESVPSTLAADQRAPDDTAAVGQSSDTPGVAPSSMETHISSTFSNQQ
jgi:hypothetical protein